MLPSNVGIALIGPEPGAGRLTIRIILLTLLLVVGHALAEESPVTRAEAVYGEPGVPGAAHRLIDIYWRSGPSPMPLILYVHDGGWAFGDKADVAGKPAFFLEKGIAFASINYRLRWEFQVYDQVVDVVAAIVWLRENGDQYNLDPDKIVLMGQGSGAHLVAPVATDHSYLKAVGLSLTDVNGVVSVAGDAFDIGRQMRELGSFLQRRHIELIFGRQPAAWAAASPITHVAPGKGIPAFALLHTEDELAAIQTRAFAKTLAQADIDAIIIPSRAASADDLGKQLGRTVDATSVALLTFIRANL